MTLLLMALTFATPTADAQDWEDVYRRSRNVSYGAIATYAAAPVATAAVFPLILDRMPPPPDCRIQGLAALACILILPIVILVYIAIVPFVALGLALMYTSPLYVAGPALLLGSSMRARRALLELGHPTPWGWGAFGWTMGTLGLGTLGTGYTLLAAEEEDAAIVFFAASVALWGGATAGGVAQWTANRRRWKDHIAEDPLDAEESRQVWTIPLFTASGRF